MLAGDILTLDATGNVHRQHVASVVAAIRPRRGGGAVIGVERGFALESPTRDVTFLNELWTSSDIRMNEGSCDPDGRFYCGSMAYDKRAGAASLYRLDPDGRVQVVLDSVTISNGLDWSPDGGRVYYNDTATSRVDVFDYDASTGLTDRRTFVDLSAEKLRPDGLTVDVEGAVWVAMANGGVVRRYLENGKCDGAVEVPTKKTTACAIGGEQLDRLFITTSRDGQEHDPLAGALFAIDIGPLGLPAREFGG
jgi:sugar lactone lactonase YvrE